MNDCMAQSQKMSFQSSVDLDDEIDCAMLVGHNPTFTALINALGRCDFDNVPTCGMAVLTFPVDSWKNFATVQGNAGGF